MDGLLNAGYISASLQGFAVMALVCWRILAMLRAASNLPIPKPNAQPVAPRRNQYTLLTGMLFAWIGTWLNNGYWGAWRLTDRPDLLPGHDVAFAIKCIIIVAGVMHVYTFTGWRWGLTPVAAWVALSVALPFIILAL